MILDAAMRCVAIALSLLRSFPCAPLEDALIARRCKLSSTRETAATRWSPRAHGRHWPRKPASLGLGAHVREQDDVTDRGRVGEEHDQPVDADAQSRSRRHPVFERAYVVR